MRLGYFWHEESCYGSEEGPKRVNGLIEPVCLSPSPPAIFVCQTLSSSRYALFNQPIEPRFQNRNIITFGDHIKRNPPPKWSRFSLSPCVRCPAESRLLIGSTQGAVNDELIDWERARARSFRLSPCEQQSPLWLNQRLFSIDLPRDNPSYIHNRSRRHCHPRLDMITFSSIS